MEKSEQEIIEIKKKYRRHIEKLEKMQLNAFAVSNIRYWYNCLSKLPKSTDLFYDFMLIDAFTTSIIISYGRLFGQGTGTTTLNKADIRKDLIPIHDEIIELRHARYAHHGGHSSIVKKNFIEYVDSSFCLSQEIQIDGWLGAPKHWGALFKWIDEYNYNSIHDILLYLTKETGIEWKFPHGPTPPWIE